MGDLGHFLGYLGAILRRSHSKLLGSGSILNVYGMNDWSGKNQIDIYSIGLRKGHFGPSWAISGCFFSYFGDFLEDPALNSWDLGQFLMFMV